MDNTNIWNKKYLEPPVVASYKTNSLSFDLSTLRIVFKEALCTFKNQSVFNKEAAYLSRFIYCLKTKLRHNKAVKMLQKINQALLRYLQMDMIKHFQEFKDMLPQTSNGTVYLPTRSMLQYLLVRLQGVAQLMMYLAETSKIAASLLNQYISAGYLWKILFLSFGMVSRIYTLSKNLAKSCCNIYMQLIPFSKSLEDLNHHWLPFNYNLPNDLKQWLSAKFSDGNIFQEHQVNITSTYTFLLNNIDNDEWFKEIDKIQVDRIAEVENNDIKEDYGIPLKRIKPTKKTKKKHASATHQNITDSINSLIDLKKFQTNFKRNPEKYTNNFKKIDRLQCNILQKLLSKSIRKMEKNVHDSVKTSEYLMQTKKVLQCLCNK